MIQFDAAPAIPVDYPRLRALSSAEVTQARAAGYVAERVEPGEPVRRPGLDNYQQLPPDDIRDWRTRTYVIWFCYIYENFARIKKPLAAIEEIILEFRAPSVIDTPDRILGTLYAGIGAADPFSASEREVQLQHLQPHYEKAVALLEAGSSQGD